MEYAVHLLVLVAIYGAVAYGTDILLGRLGVLSAAQAVWMGVGAYTSAILVMRFQTPYTMALACALLVGALVACTLGWCVARIRGEGMVIALLAIQLGSVHVLKNWSSVTRGSLGISAIPRPRVSGVELMQTWQVAVFSVVFCAACAAVSFVMARSFVGRVLVGVRDSEAFVVASGKSPIQVKCLAFAVAGAMCGGAGSLLAHYLSFIEPNMFAVNESILILAMVIVGGSGSLVGPLCGACCIVLLPEALRLVGLSGPGAAHVNQAVFGMMLIVLMFIKPQGVFGSFAIGSAPVSGEGSGT